MADTLHQAGNRATRKEVLGRTVVFLLVLAGAAMVFLPFLYMVSTSVKSMNEVFTTPVKWIPDEFRWDNFSTAWQEHNISRYYLNSLFVGLCVTVLNLVTCSLAGYSFAKFNYPGRNFLFGLVLFTMMIPIASMIIPLYIVVKELGWINSYWGLIFPAGTSAFGIFLMRQHMLSIPEDLLDAARIDGANEPRIFVQIVLPLVKTSIASLAIFIFMWNWDSFIWPLLVVTQDDYRTLPLGIAMFESAYGTNYPQLMAVAVVAMLPVLIVFILMQRHFIAAMTMSGVKG